MREVPQKVEGFLHGKDHSYSHHDRAHEEEEGCAQLKNQDDDGAQGSANSTMEPGDTGLDGTPVEDAAQY